MPDEHATLAFGQKLLSLLDTGSFTASYKYATLLALVDTVLASTAADGSAPRVLHAREVGRRVFELYWPQARLFSEQGTLAQSPQRDIVAKIAEVRAAHGMPSHCSVEEARQRYPVAVGRLEDEAVVTVIRMPLPKLQRFGAGRSSVEDRFIYEYGWPDQVPASRVRRPDFDDRLWLVGEAGEHLAALAGLVRPVVQREWLRFVARRNPQELDDELRLEAHLFGAARQSLVGLRDPLLGVQAGRCFYCGGERGPWEVDHFLPWARFPDNRLDNLVVAHRRCNNDKRDALAALVHLARWWRRFDPASLEHRTLRRFTDEVQWPRRPAVTSGAARALYWHQPDGTKLWLARHEVESLDRRALGRILRPRAGRQAAEEGGGYDRGPS